MRVDAREKTVVLAALTHEIRDSYVFPDMADKLVKMLQNQQVHDAYAGITSANEFSQQVNKHLAEISHDPHLRVIYSSRVLPETPELKPGESPGKSDALEKLLHRRRKTNYGFETIEHLPGNVGYLKFNQFADAEQGGDRIAAAMAWFADTDALIIDLQDNRGGTPGMVQLVASYFFSGEEPVHLNDLAYRRVGTRTEELTQWWTLPYVPGRRYLDREVYILTSQRSFSAAEEFAYDLQTRKRATIVGETTGGGANDNALRRLDDHYLASISIGHAINPITHTNWEGKGIQPDVKVPREQALRTAQRLALQHLVEKTQDPEALGVLQQALSSLEGTATDQR